MAWKSITFKQAADGRFVPKGGAAPKAASTTGKQVAGVKSAGGWKASKGVASAAPKTAGDAKQASSQAVDKHRHAMSGIILEAKEIARDSRDTLNSIKDPDLKRSAAR